ncbi:MAG TPA: tetratricopeptide repeat protein [Limnochordales bacterium]
MAEDAAGGVRAVGGTSAAVVRPSDSPRLALRQLVRYAEAGPPGKELSRAFVEFFGPDTEARRGPSGASGALFMEWFLFDRPMASGETPARQFALASASLSLRQRRLFFELADSMPGFFEVVGFGAGGMWLVPFPDPSGQRSGEATSHAIWVEEPLASRRLSRGDIVWTRLLRWRSRWHLATCCFVLPASARQSLQPLARLRPRYSEQGWRRLMGQLQPQFFRDLLADREDPEPIAGPDSLPLSDAERRYYVQLAGHLIHKGALRSALRLYWRVLNDNPRDVEARLGVAQARWRQGRLGAAERALRSVLGDEPEHPAAMRLLGQLLLSRGEVREGEALLRSYVERTAHPEPQVLFSLGRLSLLRGQVAQALELFQRALREQASGRHAGGWPAGGGPGAAAALPGVADGDGDPYGRLLVEVGWELLRAGQVSHAKTFFSAACSSGRSRAVQASAWHGLGESLSRQRRYLQAATAYMQALRMGLDQPKLWAEVGRCYARCGRLQEAEAAYRTSVNRLPGYARGLTGLAAVHLRRGLVEKALAEARRAQALEPTDSRALAIAGACWLRQGMPQQAARLLARAVALNPRDVNARRLWQAALRRLEAAGDPQAVHQPDGQPARERAR